MHYGHFDNANCEYVIERPDTPTAWTNYIGNRLYGGVITNNAGGYSFYRSSGIGRFTRLPFNAIPMDQPGRYFYVRDNENADYWSASWQPVGKPLDQYKTLCRFGTSYAILESQYAGIRSVSAYYVPIGENFEYWRLKLINESSRRRRLSVFTYCEFTSEWHIFQDAFNLQYTRYIARSQWKDGFAECSVCGNLKEDTAHFANRDQSRWSWMTAVGAEVTGYDLDREKFLGAYRTYQNPIAVEQGACGNSLAYGNNACGSLKMDLDLAPGEEKELIVMLGVGRAQREGRRARRLFGSVKQADAALTKLKSYWQNRLSSLRVNTPDPEMNQMLNFWGPYDALMNFYWCRSASLVYSGDGRDGYGFRDTVQDLVGNAALIPSEVRERLELMLTGQESNGGAMPEVKPYSHDPGHMPLTSPEHQRSDDCLWFFNAIPAYVNETGDFAFYKKALPYSDKGKDTVFGHLKRALLFNLKRTGKNGLPCGLSADWDDCIRMGHRGETTMVAFQMRYGFGVYADIARQLRRPKEAAWADKERAKLDRIIQKHTWDGAWFLRGITEKGKPLGSAKCEEGKIFQVAQTWAVLSGAATHEQARQAMDAVERHLETPYGCMAVAPPYVKAECKELRMVLMNSGEKENAGIFSHSQGWIIMANCLLGNGERAYRVYRANLPARFNDLAEIRKIEPYVYCQSTSSRYSAREGTSHIPWLTGSAGWSYYAPTQYILGIRPEHDGLRLDPCIPSAWTGFTAERMFRGKKIAIEVKNPHGINNGVRRLTLNGKRISGNLIPVAKLARNNHVICELG